jgi:hypothetical protein
MYIDEKFYNRIKYLFDGLVDEDLERSKYFISVLDSMRRYLDAKIINHNFFIKYYSQVIPDKYLKIFDELGNDYRSCKIIKSFIITKMIELKEKYMKEYTKAFK